MLMLAGDSVDLGMSQTQYTTRLEARGFTVAEGGMKVEMRW